MRKPPMHPVVSRVEAREGRPASKFLLALPALLVLQKTGAEGEAILQRGPQAAPDLLGKKLPGSWQARPTVVRPSVAGSRHPGFLAALAPAAPHPNIATLGSRVPPRSRGRRPLTRGGLAPSPPGALALFWVSLVIWCPGTWQNLASVSQALFRSYTIYTDTLGSAWEKPPAPVPTLAMAPHPVLLAPWKTPATLPLFFIVSPLL